MASPFTIFRKNQKLMLAGLTLLAMFAFVFLDMLSRFSGGGQADPRLNKIVVETVSGNLTEGDLALLRNHRFTANTFVYRLVGFERAFGPTDWNSAAERRIVLRELVRDWMLAQEGRKLGISISDSQIEEFIDRISGRRINSDQFRDTLKNLRMSGKQLYEAMRDILLAHETRKVLTPARVYGDDRAMISSTPEQVWQNYRRLHETRKIELAALPVDEFLDKVEEPTEAQIQELFAEGRERYPAIDEFGENLVPGFYQRRRVQFQYLVVKSDEVRKRIEKEKPVSDKEIAEYYEKNKELYRIPKTLPDDQKPDVTSPGETKSDAAKPDATKSEESPKPDGDKKPKADKPDSDKKPAETETKPEPATETKPEETRPADPKKPEEQKPDEQKPEGSECVQDKPDASNSEEARPTEDLPKPGDKPADEKPAADKPTGDKPADNKPELKSPDAKPADKAGEPNPAESKLDDVKPDDAKPGDAKPDEPKYKPLDEALKDEIREKINAARSAEALKTLVEALQKDLRAAGQSLKPQAAYKANAEQRKKFIAAAAEKLKSFARKPEIVYGDTEPILWDKFHKMPGLLDSFIGRIFGYESLLHENIFGGDTLASVGRWEAEKTSDKNEYLFWKVRIDPDRLPKLDEPGVRDEVIKTWKRLRAVKLAQDRADELAKLARASQKPLAEALGQITVTGDAKSPQIAVKSPEEFPWMRRRLASMNPNEPAELSDAAIENPQPSFMRAVFDEIAVGDVGVAVNPHWDGTVVYVVKVISATVPKREVFLRSRAFENSPYANIESEREAEINTRFLRQLEQKYTLKWHPAGDDEVVLE